MNTFKQSAIDYYNNYGWVCHPLGPDNNGLPKRPITKDWTNIEPNIQVIENLNWDDASGIGLITGAKSGISAIDIDDSGLALLIPLLFDHHPLLVSTARNRGHMYVQEIDGASASSKFFVVYQGRDICIELKGNGTQVAMPPSPNYQWLLCHTKTDEHKSEPFKVSSIADAWEFIMDCINYEYGNDTITFKEPTHVNTGPRTWSSHVQEGARNDSAYVEAHRLKRSGMSEEQAIEIMLLRVDSAYEGAMSEQEIIQTVKSAYKKGDTSNDRSSRPRLKDFFG